MLKKEIGSDQYVYKTKELYKMTNESFKGQNTSAEETLRQRSFIELAQALTAQKSNTLGRPMTYCLTTF